MVARGLIVGLATAIGELLLWRYYLPSSHIVELGLAQGYSHSEPLLSPRQSSKINPSTIPAQCDSQCTSVITTLSNCTLSTDSACGCSVATKNEIKVCFGCWLNVVPTTRADMETVSTNYIAECKAAGIDVGSFAGGSSSSYLPLSTTTSSTSTASQSSSEPFSKNEGSQSGLSLTFLLAAALPGTVACLV
ncbi:hypothetical protein DL96DRAFT_789506 [Flagelloscypha sp. PMI_526]|nr:hypothetical protein DL96DRAFT_789506 [Flagelloscypha sp. PMI_526]